MRRFITILVCSLFFCAGELSAQLRGQFYTGQDGHIYFQATNVSGSYFNAAIRAISNDRDNSETITVGQGFLLGPTTPWKWYWKEGDRIYVCMGFIGLVLGVLLDETFGGASFSFTPALAIILAILTMGAFIIYFNDKKK